MLSIVGLCNKWFTEAPRIDGNLQLINPVCHSSSSRGATVPGAPVHCCGLLCTAAGLLCTAAGSCALQRGSCTLQRGSCVLQRGSCALQRGSCAQQRGSCAQQRGFCAHQRGPYTRLPRIPTNHIYLINVKFLLFSRNLDLIWDEQIGTILIEVVKGCGFWNKKIIIIWSWFSFTNKSWFWKIETTFILYFIFYTSSKISS